MAQQKAVDSARGIMSAVHVSLQTEVSVVFARLSSLTTLTVWVAATVLRQMRIGLTVILFEVFAVIVS
jgi:hypothetical protein